MDALLEDVDMLKLVFPYNITQLTLPEKAIALTHLFLTGSSDNISMYLLQQITEDILNFIIDDGKYRGSSLLFFLCYLPRGRALLVQSECRLARLVSPDTLNHIITVGETKGQSAAYHLVLTLDQNALLLQEFLQLHLILNATALNHVISTSPPSPHQDISVAFLLARTPLGRNLLQLGNCRLCELLSPATLSHVMRKPAPAHMIDEKDVKSNGASENILVTPNQKSSQYEKRQDSRSGESEGGNEEGKQTPSPSTRSTTLHRSASSGGPGGSFLPVENTFVGAGQTVGWQGWQVEDLPTAFLGSPRMNKATLKVLDVEVLII